MMKRNRVSLILIGIVVVFVAYLFMIPSRYFNQVKVRNIQGEESALEHVNVRVEVGPVSNFSSGNLYHGKFDGSDLSFKPERLFNSNERPRKTASYEMINADSTGISYILVDNDKYEAWSKDPFSGKTKSDINPGSLSITVTNSQGEIKTVEYKSDKKDYLRIITTAYKDQSDQLALLVNETNLKETSESKDFSKLTYLLLDLEKVEFIEQRQVDLSEYIDDESIEAFWSGDPYSDSDKMMVILNENKDHMGNTSTRYLSMDFDASNIKEIKMPEDTEYGRIYYVGGELIAINEKMNSSERQTGVDFYKYDDKKNEFKKYIQLDSPNFVVDRMNKTIIYSNPLNNNITQLEAIGLLDKKQVYQALFELDQKDKSLYLTIY